MKEKKKSKHGFKLSWRAAEMAAVIPLLPDVCAAPPLKLSADAADAPDQKGQSHPVSRVRLSSGPVLTLPFL